jgi:signal transduction histidine kinase
LFRSYGHDIHWVVEALFYGTSGPLVVWFSLRIIRQWNLEKELAEVEVLRLNADLQQRVEERTRELREKNEALAAANRQLQELDCLKSEFVSLVSHELRAPLTNMRGALELMEGGCPALNSTCARMFVIVNTQVNRLGRMVDEVSAYASKRQADARAKPWMCGSQIGVGEFAARCITRQFIARRTNHLWARFNGCKCRQSR